MRKDVRDDPPSIGRSPRTRGNPGGDAGVARVRGRGLWVRRRRGGDLDSRTRRIRDGVAQEPALGAVVEHEYAALVEALE